MTDLDLARQVADAVLYEGYVLYPYRASAAKNQQRFQFGVLMPPAYLDVDPSEHSGTCTESLLECAEDTELRVFVRFLQLQRRFQPGRPPWDEAVEQERELRVPVADALTGELTLPIRADAGEDMADDGSGPVRRIRAAVSGVLRCSAERLPGPYRVVRLRLLLDNRTEPAGSVRDRAEALCHAMVAAHLLIYAPGAAFLSPVDPPEWAAAEVAACRNEHTWPVLAGPEGCHDLVLSAPIILYDHPAIAPESAGNLYDATEIDEILTLRTMALTDAEKREARQTDPRAAAVIDQVDGIQPELLDRLHGAVRYLRAATRRTEPATPWWDPDTEAEVSPDHDQVLIGGVSVGRGSRVTMRPGAHRADAQDIFLTGRPAVVAAVLRDVDGQVHLAVTPSDDPTAELHAQHGRYLYFAPDELCPTEATT